VFKSKHCGIKNTSLLSEKLAVGNLSPSPQHWADSAQKTATILVDMTEYLAVWIPKKMTWGDLCAVASAAADLLDWLADRNAWVEQKKTRSKNRSKKNLSKRGVIRNALEKIDQFFKKSKWRAKQCRDLHFLLNNNNNFNNNKKGALHIRYFFFTRSWCCKFIFCKFRQK